MATIRRSQNRARVSAFHLAIQVRQLHRHLGSRHRSRTQRHFRSDRRPVSIHLHPLLPNRPKADHLEMEASRGRRVARRDSHLVRLLISLQKTLRGLLQLGRFRSGRPRRHRPPQQEDFRLGRPRVPGLPLQTSLLRLKAPRLAVRQHSISLRHSPSGHLPLSRRIRSRSVVSRRHLQGQAVPSPSHLHPVGLAVGSVGSLPHPSARVRLHLSNPLREVPFSPSVLLPRPRLSRVLVGAGSKVCPEDVVVSAEYSSFFLPFSVRFLISSYAVKLHLFVTYGPPMQRHSIFHSAI